MTYRKFRGINVLVGLMVMALIATLSSQYGTWCRIERATEANRAAAERARQAVEGRNPERVAATRDSDIAQALPRGMP